MEIAASIFSSLASTFTGAPAAAAATTASTATTAGSTMWSVLQGTATALSVLGGLRAAQAQSDALEAQSADAKVEAQIEGTRGLERRTALRERMAQDMGARDVAYAASGVDLSFGTPATARQQAVADANSAVSTDVETENIRRNRLLTRSAMYRSMAEDTRAAGTLKAVTGGISMLADVGKRR